MSVTYLDQLSTETNPLSSDKLLGVRGVGSERLFSVPELAAYGLKGVDGKILSSLMPDWAGDNFIMIPVTSNSIQNGSTLLQSISSARNIINPNSIPKSSTNRVSIFMPPGRYDLGSSVLTLNVEYVDLIALISNSVVIVSNNTTVVAEVLTTNGIFINDITFIQLRNTSEHTVPSHANASVIKVTSAVNQFNFCKFIGTNVFSYSNTGYPMKSSYYKCHFQGSLQLPDSGMDNLGLKFESCTGADIDNAIAFKNSVINKVMFVSTDINIYILAHF